MSSDHDVLSQSAAYVQGAHVIPVRVPVATLDPARLPQSDQSNSVQQQNELGPRTNVTPGFDDLSEDGIDMSLAGDAKHAAMERRYPQPMRSSVLKEAFRRAASELHQRNDHALLSSVSKPAIAVASSALPSLSSEPSGIDDHSRQQDLVTDEEDMLDLAFDIAQDLSRSRNLTPLVSLSPRKAIGSASPSQTPNQPVSNNSTPISTRKPVSWLTIRNIQWSDIFYEEMQQVLRHGVPQAKSERNKIIKKLNSKRFFEYVPFFTLRGPSDEIVLVDHDTPLWALDKNGRQVAHVDLPITYTVVKRSGIHDYLKKVFNNLAENGYRSGRSLYRKVSMQAIGISHTDVETFVKHQEVAQIQANIFSKAPGLVVQPIRSQSVMSLWECDLIDVARYASSNQQVHYLLCVCDHFSKMGFVVPLKTKESERVTYELQLIFLRESAPQTVISDNGGEFRSRAMDELAKRWNITLKHGLPYRSNSQGLIERFNRTIENAIRAWMLDYDTNSYLEALPMLLYSYNCAIHSTHGFAPFLVHRGRAPRAIHLDWKSFEQTQLSADAGAGAESDATMRSQSHSNLADEAEQTAPLTSQNNGTGDKPKPDSEPQGFPKPNNANPTASLTAGSMLHQKPREDGSKAQDSELRHGRQQSSDQIGHGHLDDVNAESDSLRAQAIAGAESFRPYASIAACEPKPEPTLQDGGSGDAVKRYVETTTKFNAVAQSQVAERISIKADKMIASTARRFTHKKNPRLKQGDHVRLDLLAFSDHRKDAKNGFKKPLSLPNWSQQVYKVTRRVDATVTAPDMYVIVDGEGDPPEASRRNAFYRYQLMLIEDQHFIDRLHDNAEKPDLNFGVFKKRKNTATTGESVGKDQTFDKEVPQTDGTASEGDTGGTYGASASDHNDKSPVRPFRRAAAPRSAKGWYTSY